MRQSAWWLAWLCLTWAVFAAEGQAKSIVLIDEVWRDEARLRDIPIRVRLAAVTNGPVPLILVSHPQGGGLSSLAGWSEHWAAQGYAVLHVQHAGSDEAYRPLPRRPQRGVLPEQLLGRIDDLAFVREELLRRKAGASNGSWLLRIDPTRVALAGQGLGARVAQALAGERFPGPIPALTDPAYLAFILISPAAQGQRASYPERYEGIRAPLLAITGSRDGEAASPMLQSAALRQRRLDFFAALAPGEKALIDIAEADALVLGEGRAEQPELEAVLAAARRLTSAFLDQHLRGADPQRLRQASENLPPGLRWQTK